MLGSIDQANANSNLDAGLRKKGWPKVEFIFRPEITEFLKFVSLVSDSESFDKKEKE